MSANTPAERLWRSRAEPRKAQGKSLVGYALGLTLALCASPTFAQKATQAQISRMIEVARDTCLATFPSYRGLEKRLVAKGLSQDNLGTWRGPATIVVLRKGKSSTPVCEVWMAFDSDTRDVSDTLQATLPRLGFTIQSATRRGIRLGATFEVNGAGGLISTEPMSGRTSKIVISMRSES